jgi:hypothetical protein
MKWISVTRAKARIDMQSDVDYKTSHGRGTGSSACATPKRFDRLSNSGLNILSALLSLSCEQ